MLMNPLAKRLLHTGIAGLIAIAVYGGTAMVVASNPQLAADFATCGQDTSSIGSLVCLAFTLGYAIIIFLAISLPLAIALSATYLKLALFSLRSAILIPLGANLLAIAILVGLALLAGIILPFGAMLAVLLVSHIVLGYFRRHRP
jgi:hypothetical protein